MGGFGRAITTCLADSREIVRRHPFAEAVGVRQTKLQPMKAYAFGGFFRCKALPPFEPASAASERSRENDRLAGFTDRPLFRPAWATSSGFWEKLRFSLRTLLPPLLEISRHLSGDMDAIPRFIFFGSSIG